MILQSKCDQASNLRQQLGLASELGSDMQDMEHRARKWLVDFNDGNTHLVLFEWSNNYVAIDMKM